MGDLQPRAGVHYPRSTGEFQSSFATDADCLDFLDWLRWPGGFVCPKCGHGGGWAVADGRYKCVACSKRTSVTAGTLFDRRRTPGIVRSAEYPYRRLRLTLGALRDARTRAEHLA